MKALVILSTMLNALFVGALAFFALGMEDDAAFIANYLQSTSSEKQLVQEATKLKDRVTTEVEQDFDALLAAAYGTLTTDQISKLTADLNSPEAVQNLLVRATRSTIANNEERMREEQASVERLKMLRNDFNDFEEKLIADREQIMLDEKDFSERKETWEINETNGALNQLVGRINKAKKAQEFLNQFQGRPVKEQVYILSQLKKPESVSALFNGLPQSEQDAIKEAWSNPLDNPSGQVGMPSSIASN